MMLSVCSISCLHTVESSRILPYNGFTCCKQISGFIYIHQLDAYTAALEQKNVHAHTHTYIQIPDILTIAHL